MPSYNVHGLQVTLSSNWPIFLDLVTINLAAFIREAEVKESLDVAVSLTKKRWFGDEHWSAKRVGEEEKWGTGTFVEGGAARLRSEFLQVEFQEKPVAAVSAQYLVDRKTRIASWYREVPSWGTCQEVMRRALYMPIFHLLERRGMQLLHAAAVAAKGQAFIFAGLNGSGKSSLCHSLLDDFDYMSDNYVLWDGENVLAFPEAMRLPASAATLVPPESPLVYGKRLVPISPEKTVLKAKPRCLFMLTQGSRASMTALSALEAAGRMEVIHDMTHEFPRYSFLGPLSGNRDPRVLLDLADQTRSYALTMSETEKAKELVLEASSLSV